MWQDRHTLGILAPRAVYLSGFFRKSTTSCSSSLAPSTPCNCSLHHCLEHTQQHGLLVYLSFEKRHKWTRLRG